MYIDTNAQKEKSTRNLTERKLPTAVESHDDHRSSFFLFYTKKLNLIKKKTARIIIYDFKFVFCFRDIVIVLVL